MRRVAGTVYSHMEIDDIARVLSEGLGHAAAGTGDEAVGPAIGTVESALRCRYVYDAL